MIKRKLVTVACVTCAFVIGVIVGSRAIGGAKLPVVSSGEQFVTGIGGVFFKADDPKKSLAWYREHLGMNGETQGINFLWRERDTPDRLGFTVWSAFPRDTDYFGPSGQNFMINYRVRDLDALLKRLHAQGVRQVGEVEKYPYGRFAWIVDGDGNRIELWEP